MTTEDIMVRKYRTIILHIFCFVDDNLRNLPRHSQAKLYPSELVTIGILFALKGGFFRAFYRWLKRDLLMADPTSFTVMDSYPTELIFPIRQGRSPHQVLTNY